MTGRPKREGGARKVRVYRADDEDEAQCDADSGDDYGEFGQGFASFSLSGHHAGVIRSSSIDG